MFFLFLKRIYELFGSQNLNLITILFFFLKKFNTNNEMENRQHLFELDCFIQMPYYFINNLIKKFTRLIKIEQKNFNFYLKIY